MSTRLCISSIATVFVTALVSMATAYGSSVTFASCTSGSTTESGASPCRIVTGSGWIAVNSVVAQDSISTAASVEVHGDIEELLTGGMSVPASGQVTASNTVTFTSPGPQRQGILRFQLYTLNHGGGTSYISISDGQNQQDLGTCVFGGSKGCRSEGSMTFELGVPFSVLASTSGTLYGDPGRGVLNLDAYGSFDLFEADGITPVQITYATPEPASGALLSLAVAGAGVAGLKERFRRGQRTSFSR